MIRYVNRYITNSTAWVCLVIGFLLFAGCDGQEPEYPVPAIRLITLPGYVYGDTTLMLNDTVKIGIRAETESDQALTHFNTTIVRDSSVTSIDSALHATLLVSERVITKGIAKVETWTFYVRDRDGRKSEPVSLTFKLNPASIYGSIKTVSPVTLGAQNCTIPGSFYSLAGGQVFSLSEAFNNQPSVNLLYYFDLIETDKHTLASPGANIDESNFPGPFGLSAWSVKNTTRFIQRDNISPEEFDACTSDSLILANTFEFESGKRKAKGLVVGQIYAFVADAGMKGLFKVLGVEGNDAGTISLSFKMTSK